MPQLLSDLRFGFQCTRSGWLSRSSGIFPTKLILISVPCQTCRAVLKDSNSMTCSTPHAVIRIRSRLLSPLPFSALANSTTGADECGEMGWLVLELTARLGIRLSHFRHDCCAFREAAMPLRAMVLGGLAAFSTAYFSYPAPFLLF